MNKKVRLGNCKDFSISQSESADKHKINCVFCIILYLTTTETTHEAVNGLRE